MRSAIYVRVSTVTHSQQHTIEEQISRLHASSRRLNEYGYYTCAGKRAMEAASRGGSCRSRLMLVGRSVWGTYARSSSTRS